ncbi:MAG: tetratricopeptide repeat protein [Nitriliruptoraceae bacterium]
MPDAPVVFDVTDAGFATDVIERSRTTPVVVDFWAAWCGPCRTLGPMLESAVTARNGDVVLAKVDVDANPRIAQDYRVQGIPQVFGFRDGAPVAQFTGVIPPQQLEAFFDELVPSATDRAVAHARTLPLDMAIPTLEAALHDDPSHRDAALELAELVVASDPERAEALARQHRPDPRAEQIVARAGLASAADVDRDQLRAAVQAGDVERAPELARALAADGEYDEAIDTLLLAIDSGGDLRDTAREQLLALFTALGDDDPRVRTARPRLARALF